MTLASVAKAWGLPQSVLLKKAKQGSFPPVVKVSTRTYLVDPTKVDDWKKLNTVDEDYAIERERGITLATGASRTD